MLTRLNDIIFKDYVAHKSAVTGIAMDLVNRNLVSGSIDGDLHFWSFNENRLLSKIQKMEAGITKFRLSRFNALLAVALSNGELFIVDILCRRIARNFKKAHNASIITTMEFSSDGKWLVSADSNSMLKVFYKKF